MKVSELRLGNYILHNGEVMPVVQIERRYKTIFRLNDMDVDERIIEDHFQPIPLTPERLECCGGTKNIGTPFCCIDMPSNIGQIHINPGNGMIWLKHHANENTALNPYSGNAGYYLHSLQNIFFALTGEELTINNEHLQSTS